MTGQAQTTNQLIVLLLLTSETMNGNKSMAKIPHPAEVGVWMLFWLENLPSSW
jgi:hypothetical protein